MARRPRRPAQVGLCLGNARRPPQASSSNACFCEPSRSLGEGDVPRGRANSTPVGAQCGVGSLSTVQQLPAEEGMSILGLGERVAPITRLRGVTFTRLDHRGPAGTGRRVSRYSLRSLEVDRRQPERSVMARYRRQSCGCRPLGTRSAGHPSPAPGHARLERGETARRNDPSAAPRTRRITRRDAQPLAGPRGPGLSRRNRENRHKRERVVTGIKSFGVFVEFRGFAALLPRRRRPLGKSPDDFALGEPLEVLFAEMSEKGIVVNLATRWRPAVRDPQPKCRTRR